MAGCGTSCCSFRRRVALGLRSRAPLRRLQVREPQVELDIALGPQPSPWRHGRTVRRVRSDLQVSPGHKSRAPLRPRLLRLRRQPGRRFTRPQRPGPIAAWEFINLFRRRRSCFTWPQGLDPIAATYGARCASTGRRCFTRPQSRAPLLLLRPVSPGMRSRERCLRPVLLPGLLSVTCANPQRHSFQVPGLQVL